MLVIFSCLEISAQFYSLGNDPARAKWRQIKTQNYNVIYPEEIDSLARRYVAILENLRPSVLEPLGINPKPIPVVLHPYSTISNGMVAWTPKRMELFTSPPSSQGPYMPWDKNLVLHETRHVGQTAHFTKKIFKLAYYLIGEQGTGIGVGLYPSTKFLEGDAVVAETELSSAGRGREADFLMYYRVAFLNNDFRNYDKYNFESHKYFTPNDYAYGYLQNTAIRYYTSNYFWPGEYLDYLTGHWYNPNVRNEGHKVITSRKGSEYFRLSQELMTSIWKKDLETRGTFSAFSPISKKKERLYCDYRYPISVSTSEEDYIIAVKKGMEYSSTLIRVDKDGKERIIRPFNSISSPLALSPNGKIYWCETIYKNAASLENFSVLKSYNLEENKTKTYHRDTKYFNPTISSTGDTIAVIEYPIKGSSFLVLLEPGQGSQILRIEAPQKGQLKEVTFVGNDIYCSAILDRGIGIYKLSKNTWTEIIPQQNQSIAGLRSHENNLYFSSDLDGVINVYLYHLPTGALSRITNTKYGGSDPFIDVAKNLLYCSEFTHFGYKMAKINLDSLSSTPMSFTSPYKFPMAEMLSSQAKESRGTEVIDSINGYNTEKYPSKKYNKLTHLFRFHSWAPIYYNVDKIMSMSYEKYYDLASLGATVYSQNTLGTAITMLGYSYHNGFHSGHLKFSYTGFAPKIELSVDINDRNRYQTNVILNTNGKPIGSTISKTGTPYLSSNLKLYYPLNLYGGGWLRGLIPQLNWSFSNDDYYSQEKSKNIYKHQLSYGLRYYQVLSTPKSAIFPRWGFGVSAMAASAPGMGDIFSNSSYLHGYLYLPGIIRQQGIKLTTSWQYQFIKDKTYYLSSFASLPRGYTEAFPSNNYLMASLDYAIPIYLGDVSIPGILHFQRLQLIPFADYARNESRLGIKNDYYSFGADILVDFMLIRLIPLSAGVRYARTGPQGGSRNHFGFLFNLAFP